MVDQMVFAPADATTQTQLSQHLICQYGSRNVGIVTGGQFVKFRISASVCDQVGPPEFTSNGATIPCSGTGGGEVQWPIVLDDVQPPLNTNGCQPVGALPAPTGVVTYGPGAVSVSLAWDTVPGAAGYHVQYRLAGQTDWIDWSPDPVNPQVTITGLEPETTYDVRVRAASAQDPQGVYTEPIQVTTTVAPPPPDDEEPEPEPEPRIGE